MRVLHVITNLGQGGAEAMLEKIIRTSSVFSPQVTHSVVSLRELDVVGSRLIEAGIEVRALRIRGAWSAIKAVLQLARIIRIQPENTVVQTWLYHADAIGGVVARMVGKRRVIWNLRVEVVRKDFRRTTFLVARLCGLLSRWIPLRIVCCGRSIMESHVALGYRADKTTVIGNGFDVARFRPNPEAGQELRSAIGCAPGDLIVGSVARLAPQKDFRTMAVAARRVWDAVPAARFLWVGRGVKDDGELARLLKSLGIEDRVLRLGRRSDVVELLNAMDVFCLSSRSEGFPNALGEAMACGLPCVTTNAGDAAYVLGDADWVVPTESPRALADALVRMLSLPASERQELGRRNRARIAQDFSMESVWERYFTMYQQLPSA